MRRDPSEPYYDFSSAKKATLKEQTEVKFSK